MKTRFWSFLLALAMLLTAASFAVPAALAADADPADVDKQIALIYSGLGELVQKDEGKEWFYTVTDLDHNGKLEFIAASQDKEKLTTSLKVWTANDDMTSLEECKLAMKEGETFPDFLTDMADTFHDVKNDAWYYLCYNNEVGGENEFTTYKTAVTLKDKELSFMTFAAEHSVVVFGLKHVAYTDASGASISAEQYNNAGLNNFPGAEKSNTGFEWMKADKIKSLTDLTDAYAVFLGAKKPTESFAAVQPASMQAPDAVPAGGSSYGTPVATPVPGYNPVTPVQPAYLSITKNPTNEGRTTGETAYFVAGANAYDSLYWTFVSPYGGEYSAQNFGSMYPKSPVNGTYSTTLSISGVSKDMNGWGAYCTFYYKGQTARTSTAYLTVYDKPTPTTRPAPAPDPAPSQETGVLYGTVTDYSFSTVTVEVPGKTIATVSFDIVSIDGDLYKGAPATLYWEGMTGKGPSKYTWCFIQGSHAAPEPVYGSMIRLSQFILSCRTAAAIMLTVPASILSEAMIFKGLPARLTIRIIRARAISIRLMSTAKNLLSLRMQTTLRTMKMSTAYTPLRIPMQTTLRIMKTSTDHILRRIPMQTTLRTMKMSTMITPRTILIEKIQML